VIVQETWKQCSVSSEVAALVVEKGLDYLDAPVLRVTALDAPNPFAPNLEAYVLPNEEKIVEAVKKVMKG
jgi:pyruvate dehydrogenase E1 component beta subunit